MRHIGYRLWLVALLGATLLRAQPRPEPRRVDPQEAGASKIDVVDRLRAQLAQPGPEGAAEREVAIERLLGLSDERAHTVLRERLANTDDPDDVRVVVLDALARRLLNPTDEVFGLGDDHAVLRDRLVRAYGATLASFWLGEVDADGLLLPDVLRERARTCLVRMPVRPLTDGLRQIAADQAAPIELRIAVLRAAGDTQNLLFGRLLADFVAVEDPALQRAARVALRYLTFVEEPFERREQFDAWFQRFGNRRYLEVAEEAARLGARRARQQREELLRVRQQAAGDFVRAMTERRNGIDWPAIQARTLGDDAGTLRVCLQQLQKTLPDVALGEDQATRHAFARALLQRYRGGMADPVPLRAQLLEVAAHLCRSNEAELATELSAELLQQLGGNEAELQLAALRGLRRFPSPDARATVVRVAQSAMAAGAAGDALLSQALQTLSSGGEAGWRAPIDGAPDRAAWLELVQAVSTGNLSRDRRNEALAVALLPDRDGKRVPDIFDMLLAIANDSAREPEYRKICLIHMQSWRDQTGRSDLLVSAYAQLLGDAERDVRQFVAVALQRLPDGTEEQKKVWTGRIIAALRERLPVETNMAVLPAMLDCLVAASRGPLPPGSAIGALNMVLDTVPMPVPQEQQARTDALLRALTTIAASPPAADQQQWLGACEMLLRHERRLMLRLVLENHNAAVMAKDVASPDATVAQRARSAMRFLLLAALLKPAREGWSSTEALKDEATDVRSAFEALPMTDRLPESLQEPRFRLLRLDVLLACSKTQDVIRLGTAWIDEREGEVAVLTPEQQDAVRVLVAEAHLMENKVDAAAAALARVDAARAAEPRAIDLSVRIGRALLAGDGPARAVEWLDRAVRGTAEEDPAFRVRLLALWQARIRANPADREAVLAEADQRAALFESPDCPEELKEDLRRLRAKPQ